MHKLLIGGLRVNHKELVKLSNIDLYLIANTTYSQKLKDQIEKILEKRIN